MREQKRERERRERRAYLIALLLSPLGWVVNDGAVNTRRWGSVLATATIEVHNHPIRKPHFLEVRVHSFLCHHRALVDTLLSRPFPRLIVVASRRKKAPESLDLTVTLRPAISAAGSNSQLRTRWWKSVGKVAKRSLMCCFIQGRNRSLGTWIEHRGSRRGF